MRAHRPFYLRLTGVVTAVLFAVTISGTPSMATDEPGVAWTHQFGSTYDNDQVLGLAVDADGAAYVVGTSPEPLESDAEPTFDEGWSEWVFVRKLGPDGDVTWTQEFEADMVTDVAVGPEGGVFVGGFTEMDGWLRRYHADGKLDWHQDIAAARGADAYVWGVAVDDDGSATVVGESGDAFVRKYDPDGNVSWTRQFAIRGAASEVAAVATDESGGIYVVGATKGRLGGKHRGGHDAFVRRYDPDGNVSWTRQFGTPRDDVASDVAVDAGGRVVVAGGTYGKLAQKRKGEQDAFVRVFGPDGDTVWTRQFGTTDWEDTNSVAIDDAGGIYVTGLTPGRLAGTHKGGSFLRKYGPDGAHAWTTQFGAKERGWTYAVAAHGSDTAIVAGESKSSTTPSTTDAFIRKYTPDVTPTADDARLAARDPGADHSEPDPAVGFFSRAGSTRPVFGPHTATLLADDRVLVVSGFGQSRLWDPATSAWSKAGALVESRDYGFSVSLLADGRVLVVGGSSAEAGEALGAAEIWDPATASFAPAGSMATPRMEPTLTPLPDGRVLVTGGGDIFGGSDPASAELWDPATESFGPAGTFIEPRSGHSSTLLADGRVLFVGGYDAVSERVLFATAEVWDPVTASFAPAGSLAEARYNHSATVLPDGRVLVTGGADQERPLVMVEVWDPAIASFAPAGSLVDARLGHAATALPDGRLLVLGGFDARHDVVSAEVWDPTIASFAPAGRLIERREVPTSALLPDGRVFVTGRTMDDDAYASAEVWDPATEAFHDAGSMAEIRWVESVTPLSDGRVLIVGQGDSMRGLAEVWEPIASGEAAEPIAT